MLARATARSSRAWKRAAWRNHGVSAAAFHCASPSWKDAEKGTEEDDPSAKYRTPEGPYSSMANYGIDRANPMHAPPLYNDIETLGIATDNIYEDENWKEWEDLPAPYKYYQIRLDPADVENPGILWRVFNTWYTCVPASILVALPLWAYGCFDITPGFGMACISFVGAAMFFWGASSVQLPEYKEWEQEELALYDYEAKYNDALADLVSMYERVNQLPYTLSVVHGGQRALKNVEAEAATRRVKAGEQQRMQEILDYLVGLKEAESKEVDTTAQRAFERTIQRFTDESSLDDEMFEEAMETLESLEFKSTIVPRVMEEETARVKAEPVAEDAAKAKAEWEHKRFIFSKRFGYAETEVTEAMMEKAEREPETMARLTAILGEAPTVGADITRRMPIDY